jgi:hypothetical protein
MTRLTRLWFFLLIILTFYNFEFQKIHFN